MAMAMAMAKPREHSLLSWGFVQYWKEKTMLLYGHERDRERLLTKLELKIAFVKCQNCQWVK